MKRLLGVIEFFKRLKKKPRFVYVAIGDSTVEGIGASHSSKSAPSLVFESIKQHNKTAKFHNLGKSGARISDVIDNQLEHTIELEPSLITVSVGANDLIARTRAKDFEFQLSYLLAELSQKTDARVIINNIPDVSIVGAIPFFAKALVRRKVVNLNSIIKDQARKHDLVHVDLYKNSALFIKKYPKFISKDGFHPSDTGYALWAAVIISQLHSN